MKNTPLKIVFHIDELAKWGRLIANIKNTLKVTQDREIVIAVVANAEGIKGYLEVDKKLVLLELFDQDVDFKICQNSMRGFEVDESELPSYVKIVPVAVIELAEKQHAGFAYIKL